VKMMERETVMMSVDKEWTSNVNTKYYVVSETLKHF